jgi:hypothetical protein
VKRFGREVVLVDLLAQLCPKQLPKLLEKLCQRHPISSKSTHTHRQILDNLIAREKKVVLQNSLSSSSKPFPSLILPAAVDSRLPPGGRREPLEERDSGQLAGSSVVLMDRGPPPWRKTGARVGEEAPPRRIELANAGSREIRRGGSPTPPDRARRHQIEGAPRRIEEGLLEVAGGEASQLEPHRHA